MNEAEIGGKIESLGSCVGCAVQFGRTGFFHVRQKAEDHHALRLRTGAYGLSVFRDQHGSSGRDRRRADGDSVLRQDLVPCARLPVEAAWND